MLRISILFSVCLATVCFAQERLTPCVSPFESDSIANILTTRVIESLKLDAPPSESGGSPIARVIIQPGWPVDPESAVTVYVPDGGDSFVEAVIAKEGISGANLIYVPVPNSEKPTWRFGINPQKPRIEILRFRNTIERKIAVHIGDVFLKHIRDARYPEPKDVRFVLHATSYTFISSAGGSFCGHAESPDDGTLQGKLVKLSDVLFEYAQSDPSKLTVALDKLLNTLSEVNQ